MQITLTDVSYAFPKAPHLFQGLNWKLHPGEMLAITGPSGSGKSTLLSLLAGWVRPTSGEIHVPADCTMAWVFQNPHGVAGRRALDHVTLPLFASGVGKTEATTRALEIMESFGLSNIAHQSYSSLSGGEALRLMLARAVAKHPMLLLVDEPTAQLDTKTAATVNSVLGSLASVKTIVVIATHDQATAEQCHGKIDLRDYAS